MTSTNSKPPTVEVEGCLESMNHIGRNNNIKSIEETQSASKRPSAFVQNEVARWQRQFANRTLTKQQKKLLVYFSKVQGRRDTPHRENRPAICHVINRKGVNR